MTFEEYLAWELNQDIRYEYINGEVFAMTGGTIPHILYEGVELETETEN